MDDNKIVIEGQSYAIDDFQLGDLEWLEEFLDKPLTDLANLNSVKAGIGLVYLIKRRENPEFTLEDARKVKMTALFSAAEDDAPAAKAKAAKRPTKPAGA